jgi:hypothetical protein
VGRLHFPTPRREPLTPGSNRLGVVKPQDLDIGDKKTGAFNRWHDFGQGGQIAAGKDIFRDPWIDRTRPIRSADSVNKSDPVLVEQMRDFPEVSIVMGEAHMFEHADRDNPVETPVEFAVIGEPEIGCPRQAQIRGTGFRYIDLSSRQGEAGHARAAKAGQVNRHAAKAAANIEDALAGFDQEFRRDMPLFGELRLFEIFAAAFEMGAGILQPGIEELGVEGGAEIVVVRSVAFRA